MKKRRKSHHTVKTPPLGMKTCGWTIEKRAYELWLVGGCRHGNDLEDWLQAEREVMKAGRKREQAPTIP